MMISQINFTSKLPIEILQHIISFLPLQSAARTMLLSRHWRQAWNLVSYKTGRIEDLVPVTATFLRSVNWVLNPLPHPWKLRFQTEDGRMEMIATTGVHNKLRLDFSGGDQDFDKDLPPYYLELTIKDEWGKPLFPFLSSLSKFRVNSLCLTGVDIFSGEIVSSMISDLFRSLERLEIRNCSRLFGFCVTDGLSKLKSLSIIDCDQLESVSIVSHSLKSFRFRGRAFPSDIYMLADDVKAEDVMFDFRDGPVYEDVESKEFPYCFYFHQLVRLFLRKAEHVTISQWTFQAMIKPRLQYDSDIQFLYLKELWWTTDSMREDRIDDLISFLGACPAIQNLFITVDERVCSLPTSKKQVALKSRKTRLRKLKMVKMEGFPKKEMIMLAEKILKIATKDPVIMEISLTNTKASGPFILRPITCAGLSNLFFS